MNNILSTGLRPLSAALLVALSGPHFGAGAVAESCVESAAAEAGCSGVRQVPALALAGVYEPGVDLSAYWVSEKLDGIRAYWDGSRLLTRGGNPIHAPDWFTAGLPPRPLDGELWIGRGRFQALMSTVRDRRPDEEAWRRVRYRVFDLPGSDTHFTLRMRELQGLLSKVGNHYVSVVEQRRVDGSDTLMALLRQVSEQGGEGLMLRRDAAPYRAGRSDDLLKLKLYRDAEARVLAHLPGQGKYQGMMGSLLVVDEQGRRFRLGSGFSDAERRNPPLPGSVVTFKYHGRTKRGIPRFASFLRLRDEP